MPKRPRRSVLPPPSELFGLDPKTGKPLEGYTLPEPLIDEAWYRFFWAVRMMVGRKRRGLLPAWDDASRILADLQIRDENPQAIMEALEPLCRILECPEAAKPKKFHPFLAEMRKRTKAILVHCMKLRRRYGGRQAQYTPLKATWYVEPFWFPGDPPWPGPPVRTDSQAFYRIALQEPYGPWKFPDEVLHDCVVLWNKPAEAALTVLASWAGLGRAYLARRIYTRER
jgi:hypothetical protein